MDEISSPISAQIFEFCDSELFHETLQNSEVASSSNCCYEENSFSLPPDIDISTTTTTTTTTTTSSTVTTNTDAAAATNNNNSNLSVIFDSTQDLDNDISASINFSPSHSFPLPPFLTSQHDQIDYASLQSQIPDGVDGLPTDPMLGPPLTSVFDEDCLSSVPSYLAMNPTSSSCSFLCPPFMPGTLSADSSTIYGGGILDLQQQELDFQGENGGIYTSESMQRVFNPGDLQALGGNESQQLVSGGANSAPLASKMEESTFKVGKLSVEQRKEKIHRYMKKRNERNFSKKIKYACRKTLADSRPRVRGRFAKNDDFGDTYRLACSNHEEDDDEEVVVKEEDDMVESSDIFAHISGVNSFKCNYTIQSWI